MQISSANLLATQAQTVRPRNAAGAAFEPIAFKSAPPAAAPAKPADPKAADISPGASLLAASGPAAGYVRPGTNLDIKI